MDSVTYHFELRLRETQNICYHLVVTERRDDHLLVLSGLRKFPDRPVRGCADTVFHAGVHFARGRNWLLLASKLRHSVLLNGLLVQIQGLECAAVYGDGCQPASCRDDLVLTQCTGIAQGLFAEEVATHHLVELLGDTDLASPRDNHVHSVMRATPVGHNLVRLIPIALDSARQLQPLLHTEICKEWDLVQKLKDIVCRRRSYGHFGYAHGESSAPTVTVVGC
mmetsp:Transcript_27046/g.48184  ORF Transcript_27046/g.48184 Transcript_27046/m.48184 type:complete len:223 (+) Transcript_27046:1476-2144(+)